MTNVIARADSVSDFLEFALFHLFPVIIDLCVGSTYLTAKYGSGVTVVLLATSAGYFFALATTRTKQAQLRSERIDRGDDLSAIRTESLSHIDLVKYFAAERYEIKRYRTAYCQVQRANMTSTLLSRATDAGEDLITELGKSCSQRYCPDTANKPIATHAQVSCAVHCLLHARSSPGSWILEPL